MAGVRLTTGVAGAPLVHDREAGDRRREERAGAFGRALAELGEEPEAPPPVATALQRTRRDSRRQTGKARHIDVVA